MTIRQYGACSTINDRFGSARHDNKLSRGVSSSLRWCTDDCSIPKCPLWIPGQQPEVSSR